MCNMGRSSIPTTTTMVVSARRTKRITGTVLFGYWRTMVMAVLILGSLRRHALLVRGDDDEGVAAVDADGTCSVAGMDNHNNNNADRNTCRTEIGDAAADVGAAAHAVPLPAADADGYVRVAYGEAQQLSGPSDTVEATLQTLREAHRYMHAIVYATDAPSALQAVGQDCLFQNELCGFWCSIGECLANPSYMNVSCAPCCHTCEQLSFEYRCPMPDPLPPSVWNEPGDVNRFFETLVTRHSNTTVLLQPGKPNGRSSDSPWIVMLDDFLSEHECETLIALGAKKGYERSKDVGAKKRDGTYDANISTGRTSTNAWCTDECFEDETTRTVLQKIENLTGIPDANSEYLQLLRYDVGQFYEQHHDYIHFHLERLQGVRIATVFLYLNDVEEGGGTNFPLLDVTVQPKRGRALIWPSVKDEDPIQKDPRTDHQALPVIKGTKYGANAWLHQRDFKTPFASNCI